MSYSSEQEAFLAEEEREADNLRRWSAANDGKVIVKSNGQMVIKLPPQDSREAGKEFWRNMRRK